MPWLAFAGGVTLTGVARVPVAGAALTGAAGVLFAEVVGPALTGVLESTFASAAEAK